jgi:putative lipase involved disintegration of autophagic bodies
MWACVYCYWYKWNNICDSGNLEERLREDDEHYFGGRRMTNTFYKKY